MPAKRALIVDDSKSARFFLSRMLKAHDLEVDAAESAEEAIEYLTAHRPDVIFMDHLMPGMDGFQAVRVIKENPRTATIPIMMYTSQRGELYVGQARALGAVGVLPKEIQPVEVSRVLESLHLVPAAGRAEGAVAGVATAPDAREVSELDANLRRFLERLFEQQTETFKRELLDGYEAVARRVAEEIKEEDAQNGQPAAEPAPPPPPETSVRPVATLIAIGALVFLSLLFFGLYFESEQRWMNLREENAELVSALEDQQIAAATETISLQGSLREQRDLTGSTDARMLETIEWSVNQAGAVGPEEIALNDRRLELLRGLVERLLAVGFTGVVRLETHAGRFCLVGNAADGYALPPGDLPAASCDVQGNPGLESGERSSIAFANFLAGTDELTGGEIEIEVVPFGVEAPLVEYPQPASGVTAGEWNRIASLNNRVRFELTAY